MSQSPIHHDWLENRFENTGTSTDQPVHSILHAVDEISFHIHPALEFLLVAQGAISLHLPDGEVRVPAGEFVMAHPWQPHATHFADQANAVLAIQIDPVLFARDPHFSTRRFDLAALATTEKGRETFHRIRSILIRIFFEIRMKRAAWQMAAESLALELIFVLLREVPHIEENMEDQPWREDWLALRPSLSRAVAFVQSHAQDDIGLDDVANAAHLSSSYLSRLFKSETSGTFKQFLTSVRVRRSLAMLAASEAPSITTVAFDCGFPNVKAYNQAFRKAFGVSPREWKQQAHAIGRTSRYGVVDESGAMKSLYDLLTESQELARIEPPVPAP